MAGGPVNNVGGAGKKKSPGGFNMGGTTEGGVPTVSIVTGTWNESLIGVVEIWMDRIEGNIMVPPLFYNTLY